MTTSHSIASKIVWGALMLFAAATAACGGASQSMTGTAPSSLSAVAGAIDEGGSFGMLKEGKGKGPSGTPTTGATPTTGSEPGEDQDGDGNGHGHAAVQLEGFTSDITGTCPDLTIVINGHTVTTNTDTDFQRAECTDLKPDTTTTTTTPTSSTAAETAPQSAPTFHLHIAATMDPDTGMMIATYVRMQGPKIDRGDNDSDDETTTSPTTGTAPTK